MQEPPEEVTTAWTITVAVSLNFNLTPPHPPERRFLLDTKFYSREARKLVP